jgi:hypothetical protein
MTELCTVMLDSGVDEELFHGGKGGCTGTSQTVERIPEKKNDETLSTCTEHGSLINYATLAV